MEPRSLKTITDPSPQQIADLILARHSETILTEQFQSFEWKKKRFEEAVFERAENERTLRQAIRADDVSEIKASIFRIHKWGFGSETPNSKGDEWLRLTVDIVREFSKHTTDPQRQKALLKALLESDGVGIARASKWVCFCDQNRYAIYDSRVSIALREVVWTNDKRVFPTVGRKKTKSSQYPYADAIKPSQMVEKYFLYLDTLKIISDRTRLKVAEIEMALFMIGK